MSDSEGEGSNYGSEAGSERRSSIGSGDEGSDGGRKSVRLVSFLFICNEKKQNI